MKIVVLLVSLCMALAIEGSEMFMATEGLAGRDEVCTAIAGCTVYGPNN